MTVRIDVCIATFRRPQLADTLRSVIAQELPASVAMQIIVSDNDDHPTSAGIVDQVRQESGATITLLHSPARNISLARNACLAASNADFIAFIDDDETAQPGWLASLLAVISEIGADVVLGPVSSIYPPEAPAWVRRGDFHSTLPVWSAGKIRTGYSCNVLIRRNAASVRGQTFDLARGRTGGEDTAFFDAIHRAGGTIAFAPDAKVSEIIPIERTSFKWLAKRRFRSGQTHGGLLRAAGAGRVREGAVATAKLSYCLLSALAGIASPVASRRALLRGALHAGTVSAMLGGSELVLYGDGAGRPMTPALDVNSTRPS